MHTLTQKTLLTSLSLSLVFSLFLGCSGDSSSDTSTTPTSPVISATDGYFIDSKVIGLNYSCEDGSTGTTDQNGAFYCETLPVTFYLCDLKLGTINDLSKGNVVYPQDILSRDKDAYNDPDVIALAQLLISVDDDGDYQDSITINPSLCSSFTSSGDFDANNLGDYSTEAGVSLVDADEAASHLQESYGDYVLVEHNIGATAAITKYVEVCQVQEDGTGIASGLQTWEMHPDPDVEGDGEVYLSYEFDGEKFSSLAYIYTDVFSSEYVFSYSGAYAGGTWKHYDWNLLNLVGDDLWSLVNSDESISEYRAREVLNFYDPGTTSLKAHVTANNHVENMSCAEDRLQAEVGCEYMYSVTATYTIVGDNGTPSDPEPYTINSQPIKYDQAVIAGLAFDEERAFLMHQCWYPNTQGRMSGGYVVYTNDVNRPLSKPHTPTCVGSGCASVTDQLIERQTTIRLDLSNKKTYTPAGEDILKESTITAMQNHNAFTITEENEPVNPPYDETITTTFTFSPITYKRDVIYCDYTQTTGVCDIMSDNPDIVRIPKFE